MTMLTILGIIAVVALIIFLSIAINRFADGLYDYKPFKLSVSAGMTGAILLLLMGFLFLPEGQSNFTSYEWIVAFTTSVEYLDSAVCFALVLLIVVLIYIRLIAKTNIFIATYAILIQLVFAVLIFIGIILFIMVLNKNDND